MSDKPENLRDHRLEDILAYKQGFLTEAEHAEVEQHLRDCKACQQTLEEVSLFLPAMQKALTQPEPSTEEMLAKAKAEIRSMPPKPAPLFTRMRLALLAVGAAAASTIFIVLQPLLQQTGGAVIAHSPPAGLYDAGDEELASPAPPPEEHHGGGRVFASPHPPPGYHNRGADAGPDAGTAQDAGLAQ